MNEDHGQQEAGQRNPALQADVQFRSHFAEANLDRLGSLR